MADQNENCSSVNSAEPETKKQKIECYRSGVLLGYGNPLLDIQVVGNDDFLKKYDLLPDNAILADEKHKPMYQEMIDSFDKVEYIPGGATLNSIKVAQWMMQTPQASTFFGCVSDDKFGRMLEDKAREAGVNVQCQYTEKEPTGTCGVIVTDQSRSLCANLAAANCFTEDHLNIDAHWALVEKASYYYCASFPLTVSPSTILRLAKHSHSTGKTFCMNLSAPFLIDFFKEPMMKVFPYIDILFGNESEAATFSKVHKFETEDISEIAQKIAAMPKENKERGRMVVITQGELPVVVAHDGQVTQHKVIPIKAADIVDTNGAGDAFVGGFLAQLILGRSVEDCVRCGCYTANLVIQRSGCTTPDTPDFV